jgi:putative ATP-binding cassette transporter
MTELSLFFKSSSRAAWLTLLALSVVSACSNTAILLLVNRRVAGGDVNSSITVAYMLLFLLSVMIFGLSHKYLISGATKLVESAICAFRVRIFERIAQLNLRDVEKLNINDIYVCINTETQVIADASFTFAAIGEQALIVLFTLGYIASISLYGVFCAVIFILIAAAILLRGERDIGKYHQEAFKHQGKFTEYISDLLRGFKEIKLNSVRASDLTRCASFTAHSIFISKNDLTNIFANKHVYSELSYFTFVGLTVFAIPLVSSPTAPDIAQSAVSALFLIGPTFAVISAIPSIQRIAASAKAILLTEISLGKAYSATNGSKSTFRQFQRISMHKVAYQYDSQGDGFHFGAIDLDIQRGEIVFITGRNGSGKSTLLKLLTGLYFPCSGELRLDNEQVETTNIDAYRNLFSAIFSDNYLSNVIWYYEY